MLFRSVISAASGPEALEADLLNQGPIAVLITDMVMPGINGSVLAGLLRERRPGLSIIYISGYPGDTPAGGDSFLQKPFTPASLTAKVREVLDRRASSIAAGKC